jgi:hypothetical protein
LSPVARSRDNGDDLPMRTHFLAAAGISILACTAHAQATTHERTLGPPTVVGTEAFQNIAAVRELSDGKVLVIQRGPPNAMVRNMMKAVATEAERRGGPRGGAASLDSALAAQPTGRVARVVMLNATLTTATTVGHAGTGAGEYAEPEGFIAGAGDTTLIVDLSRGDIPVIDPAGNIVTSRTLPVPQMALIALSGTVVDHAGRLLYLAHVQVSRTGAAGMEIATPDTAPITAYDFKTRGTIPVAQVHVEPASSTMESDSTKPGMMRMHMKTFAFPAIDDWVLMPDGTIAIIRGADLHVDWIAPNGRLRSTPPIPYTKVAVTDSDKVKFRAAHSLFGDSLPMMPRNISMTQAEPESWPQFKPPFSARGAKAAPDGTIWIPARIISPDVKEGYDVIGPDGRVRERVLLAKGQSLVGFGKGVVYVSVSESQRESRLARVPLH